MSQPESIAVPEMTEEEALEMRRLYWEAVAAIMRAKVDAYMLDLPLPQHEEDCGTPSGYLH